VKHSARYFYKQLDNKRAILSGKMNLPYFNHIQVNLIGLPYGLSSQETEDLWMQADINGNGVVGYEEFKVRYIPDPWY
jgi:hypothetical protein